MSLCSKVFSKLGFCNFNAFIFLMKIQKFFSYHVTAMKVNRHLMNELNLSSCTLRSVKSRTFLLLNEGQWK